jgi:hypothetical protein
MARWLKDGPQASRESVGGVGVTEREQRAVGLYKISAWRRIKTRGQRCAVREHESNV